MGEPQNQSVTIRTEEARACLFCRVQGEQLYTGLRDRFWGIPGVWGFRKCLSCGLIWLDPRPRQTDSGKVYGSYQTHSASAAKAETVGWRGKTRLAIYSSAPGYGELADGWLWRLLGHLLSSVLPLKDVRSIGMMTLDEMRKGALLEVGCGNGLFLSFMKKVGWEVLGVEPDAIAANLARELFGVPVITGTLPGAALPDKQFDAVVLSHVIEHVYDPVELLSECHRVVKPRGRLIVVTPNAESWGHRLFRDSWRDLDPPRHLHLFTLQTLRRTAEMAGVEIQMLRTSSRIARGVWAGSRAIQHHGDYSDSYVGWPARLRGLAFQLREEFERRTTENVGEEAVLVATRGV